MDALMKYIARIYRCNNIYRNETLAEEGIDGYQHIYIMKICNNPGVSQEQLSRMIYVNKSTVARQIAALEKKGFVKRRNGRDDKRTMLLYPTQKGRRIYPKVKQTACKWNERLMEGFSEQEKEWLVEKLAVLTERAEAEVKTGDDKR